MAEQTFGKTYNNENYLRDCDRLGGLTHPKQTRGAIVAARCLAGPNPTMRCEHAATGVAIVVVGPVIEAGPYPSEEKVSAKAEATKAVVVKMQEAVAIKMAETPVVEVSEMPAEESMTANMTAKTMTVKTMTAKTMAAKTAVAAKTTVAAATETTAAMATAMCHRAGRHRRGAEHNGRGDCSKSHLPPHESLSFCQATTPRWRSSLRNS
jgi:hypothetical protein